MKDSQDNCSNERRPINKIALHKELCDELNDLFARKNRDYGDSFHTSFVEEGMAMPRIRIGDKFNRFKTLTRCNSNDAGDQRVKDESVRDTLIDLANYALMTVMEMDIEAKSRESEGR